MEDNSQNGEIDNFNLNPKTNACHQCGKQSNPADTWYLADESCKSAGWLRQNKDIDAWEPGIFVSRYFCPRCRVEFEVETEGWRNA